MPQAGYQKHNITVEQLEGLYCDERLSSAKIGELLGIPQVTVNRYLRKYGLSETNRRRYQNGEANHNFKDGLSRSTINRTTKEICEAAEIPLNICQVCGSLWSGNLDRHHINRDRSNNTLSNIIVICPSCHAKEHNKERDRDSFGRYA